MGQEGGGGTAMRKHMGTLLLLASVFLLLTGCFFRSPEDLYVVPKAPDDFQNLQAKIDEVRGAGAEYAAPLTGNYTQTVQLRDLDGDGVQEAIAFFRVTAPATANNAGNGTGRPLKIYIYRQQPDDTFAVQTVIEGDGTAINSIAYEDLGGDAGKELVVSWQISNKVYELIAYALHGPTVEEMMRVSYTDFSILDIDKDNLKEIIVLDVNKVDGVCQANLYDYDQDRGSMVLRDAAPMSQEAVSLAETKPKSVGFLKDYEPALFVTASVSTGYLTDVFAWRDGRLENITLNAESGMSEGTYRLSNSVGLRDINMDSIMEVPRPTVFPATKKSGDTDHFWSIQWVQYDLQGQAWPVYTTYYNSEDGWYLVLPDAWSEMIRPGGDGPKITLSRRDVAGSGERAVVFSLWDGQEVSDPTPFLTIYKLTGPNRVSRSALGDRFVLANESDAIYAAELLHGAWESGLTEEGLAEQFHFIQPDLSNP